MRTHRPTATALWLEDPAGTAHAERPSPRRPRLRPATSSARTAATTTATGRSDCEDDDCLIVDPLHRTGSSAARRARAISSPALTASMKHNDGQFDWWRPRLPGHPEVLLLAGVLRRGLPRRARQRRQRFHRLRRLHLSRNGVYVTVCRRETACMDGRDNDGDGVDCADRDCVAVPGFAPAPGAEVDKRRPRQQLQRLPTATITPQAAGPRVLHGVGPEATPAACGDGRDNDFNSFRDCGGTCCSRAASNLLSSRLRQPPGENTVAACRRRRQRQRLRRLRGDFSCTQGDRPGRQQSCRERGQPCRRRAATASITTATASRFCDDWDCSWNPRSSATTWR